MWQNQLHSSLNLLSCLAAVLLHIPLLLSILFITCWMQSLHSTAIVFWSRLSPSLMVDLGLILLARPLSSHLPSLSLPPLAGPPQAFPSSLSLLSPHILTGYQPWHSTSIDIGQPEPFVPAVNWAPITSAGPFPFSRPQQACAAPPTSVPPTLSWQTFGLWMAHPARPPLYACQFLVEPYSSCAAQFPFTSI